MRGCASVWLLCERASVRIGVEGAGGVRARSHLACNLYLYVLQPSTAVHGGIASSASAVSSSMCSCCVCPLRKRGLPCGSLHRSMLLLLLLRMHRHGSLLLLLLLRLRRVLLLLLGLHCSRVLLLLLVRLHGSLVLLLLLTCVHRSLMLLPCLVRLQRSRRVRPACTASRGSSSTCRSTSTASSRRQCCGCLLLCGFLCSLPCNRFWTAVRTVPRQRRQFDGRRVFCRVSVLHSFPVVVVVSLVYPTLWPGLPLQLALSSHRRGLVDGFVLEQLGLRRYDASSEYRTSAQTYVAKRERCYDPKRTVMGSVHPISVLES